MRFFEKLRSRPTLPRAETVRLVVVEEGASGFGSVVLPDGGDETVVVAQTEGEDATELSVRVAERLACIERSQRLLERAVIVVGTSVDPRTAEARSSITKTLLTRMTANGSGELLLAAEHPLPHVRHELLGLVEALVGAFEHGTVPIRLRFRPEIPPPRKSGIYPIVTPLDAPRTASN